jgi:hypothetical protein
MLAGSYVMNSKMMKLKINLLHHGDIKLGQWNPLRAGLLGGLAWDGRGERLGALR